jgi:hypothetical protein
MAMSYPTKDEGSRLEGVPQSYCNAGEHEQKRYGYNSNLPNLWV